MFSLRKILGFQRDKEILYYINVAMLLELRTGVAAKAGKKKNINFIALAPLSPFSIQHFFPLQPLAYLPILHS